MTWYSEKSPEKSSGATADSTFLPNSSASTALPMLPGLASTTLPYSSSVENIRNTVSSRSMDLNTVSPGSMVCFDFLEVSGISLSTFTL
ncbi:hypothetical protein PS634_05443 [Pseudomonas fluorescens]|nr:hypothetical protein PS634_05443 [Pseudomonas fluorescens]